MLSDKQLLELAARVAGIERGADRTDCGISLTGEDGRHVHLSRWNPLEDDGDALRLAVKLNLDIRYESYDAGIAVIVGAAWDGAPEAVHEIFERDGACALRRAIVRAAAEIGRSKHE